MIVETTKDRDTAELTDLRRVVSPAVISGQEELENFSRNINNITGPLVDTIKRWWDGDYGSVLGEDSSFATKMQTFIDVTMEDVTASHIVRVFEHLMTGNNWHSVAGSIRYGDTKKVASAREKGEPIPNGEKKYERAVKAGDTDKIARYDAYLEIAGLVRDGKIRPLEHLNSLGDHIGREWMSEIVLKEVAEHFKSHVKKVKKWETNETSRKKDLSLFKSSKEGKAYLAIREKEFPKGIPRNREHRHEIYSRPACNAWRDCEAKFTSANSHRELFEKNPELKALRKINTEFERLNKPFTEPKWCGITSEHPRWPFIPVKLFKSNLNWNGEACEIKLALPDFINPGQKRDVTIKLTETDRFNQANKISENNTIEWRCELSGETFPVQVKGVRFDPHSDGWLARLTYQRPDLNFSKHTGAVLNAVKKRIQASLAIGDIAVVFSLEPRSSQSSNGKARAGWIKIYASDTNGVSNIASYPIDSSQNHDHRRSFHWGRRSGNSSAHGATIGITYPKLLEYKNALDREVRFIRTIRSPEQKQEALEWIDQRISAATKHRNSTGRLDAIRNAVDTGKVDELKALLKPERDRIRSLRRAFDGAKRAYRNGVAMNVLRKVHAVKSGKHSPGWISGGNQGGQLILDAVDKFRGKHNGGEVFLVIEDHKGRGSGTLRSGRANRGLSVLGPAEIYRLIEQKASFLKDAVPVATIIPKDIRKDCPKCEHTHATGQSGTFCCGNCKHKGFISEVATENLAGLFFMGKKFGA